MRIQVLYFAVFRERLKSEGEDLELPEDATVADALEALSQRHQPVRQLAGRYQTALNQEMVPPATKLADGDELALIPPVAGGSAEASAADARHVQVLDAPLSLDRCVAAVSGPRMGGLVTFTGTVRDHSRGKEVERLEYEAYAEMAEKVMRALVAEIEAELRARAEPEAEAEAGASAEVCIAVEHRIGKLAIGDAAVVIAAAAPHRAEAFEACRAMIDRLKDKVPIWKKEISPDGSEWIGLGP